jgi:hypothetical protein
MIVRRGAADRGEFRSTYPVGSRPCTAIAQRRPVLPLPTRKYLKTTRPSPAGNRASHRRQPILLRCTSLGASIETILYSASQLGQVKATGSDLFGKQCAGIRAIWKCSAAAPVNLLDNLGQKVARLRQGYLAEQCPSRPIIGAVDLRIPPAAAMERHPDREFSPVRDTQAR